MNHHHLRIEDPRNSRKQEANPSMIIEFIKKNNFSSQELQIAYNVFLGINEPENEIDQGVLELVKVITKNTKNGLALTQVVGLIEEMVYYEKAPERYASMVNSMPLIENEKRALLSIVAKKREGSLKIIDAKSDREFESIKIPPKDLEFNENEIALYLINKFKIYLQKKIKISFEE